MIKGIKVMVSALLAAALALPLAAKPAKAPVANDNDIVVLYTNDVHCGINGNIGYAGLAAYKKEMAEQGNYVVTVDNGDAVQGEVVGTLSKGEYIIDIMNEVGVDYAVVGNHEYDYGMEQLAKLIEKANAQYLSANVTYKGKNKTSYLDKTVPFAIRECGNKKVAFIGLSTPNSITSSTPTYFKENDKYVYDFNASKLFKITQNAVNQARKQGADYVVVLCHLGDEVTGAKDTSRELIANTTGIDVVLDGHAHSVIAQDVLKNKKGEDVLLSSTGTKFENLGKLTISKDGKFSTELINSYTAKDSATEEFIKGILEGESYRAACDAIVASTDVELSIAAPNGARMVRNRETAIGDLCADAYRNIAQTDIAVVNGGGIRTTLKQGDLSYADVIAVHPFGNELTSCYATGAQILDLLEAANRLVQAEQSTEQGKPVGELGGFLQVSGIRFTVDTSVATSVELNDKGEFVAVNGARRVKNVEVLDGDNWVALDPAKTYTVASHNYLIKNGGDGLNMFTKNKLIIDGGMLDNQVLITYLRDVLEGNVGALYSEPQGRITIE